MSLQIGSGMRTLCDESNVGIHDFSDTWFAERRLCLAQEARVRCCLQENTVLTGDDTIDGSLSRPDGQYLKAAKSYDTNGLSVCGAHFAVDFYIRFMGSSDSCSRLHG